MPMYSVASHKLLLMPWDISSGWSNILIIDIIYLFILYKAASLHLYMHPVSPPLPGTQQSIILSILMQEPELTASFITSHFLA